MLVNLRDICAIAEQNNMAIGAFNSPSLESVRAAIDTAEELHLPVIIDHAQGHEEITPLDVIGPTIIALAERSSAQICVHLDHCEDLAYMQRALDMGFNGAMFDGSMLPYEVNVELGARAADMCHDYGCGLECELGSMGSREAGAKVEGGTAEEAGAIYTDPDQANEFIEATGTDILAVSFGTVHGLYKGEPHLSFDVLRAIRARTKTPLVMHGGSGVSDADYHQAIDAGIRKINYFTYGSKAAGEAVAAYAKQAEVPYYHQITCTAYEAFCKDYKHVMTVFANKSN